MGLDRFIPCSATPAKSAPFSETLKYIA